MNLFFPGNPFRIIFFPRQGGKDFGTRKWRGCKVLMHSFRGGQNFSARNFETPQGFLGSRENGGQNSQGARSMMQKSSWSRDAGESNLGSMEHRT